jgi:hypothetical protein
MIGNEVLYSILVMFLPFLVERERSNFGPCIPRTFGQNKGEIVAVQHLKKILDF